MTKKKEIELARKFFDLIFREVENGEDVIYDFIDPECRYKTLCDKLNNETVKEVLELGFKQKYGEEWHGGKREQDNVAPLYDVKAVGNGAKMREALQTIHDRVNSLDEECGVDPIEVRDIARAALGSAPRNCDVGTAEEQSRRFDKVCSFRFTGNCAGCQNPLDDSAANGVSDCALFWAQMPYKEGGEK